MKFKQLNHKTMKNTNIQNRLNKIMFSVINANENGVISKINEFTTIEEALNSWFVTGYLPASKKGYKWPNLRALKSYVIERAKKDYLKQREKHFNSIASILNAGDFLGCEISVDWVKSRTWGANPHATVDFWFLNSEGHRIFGRCTGTASGCGYDKESTAIANALNQIEPLKKALYSEFARPKNKGKKPSEVFGYGSGYNLPNIEGGVGVSCYKDIFKKIGFEFKRVGSGKTFDCYTVTKLKK